MKNIYKNYLFEKHYLVSEGDADVIENQFETLFALANLFNIRIVKGEKLVHDYMIRFAAERLGENVPEPFYRGFPQTVRGLSPDQLLFDQMVHYSITYGFGNFSEAGHSLFEENFERTAFKENADIKDFNIITGEEAVTVLTELVQGLLSGTRPLSDEQYELVKSFIIEYDIKLQDIASKNTTVKLLLDTRDTRFADYIVLSDVIKLVDELNYREYGNKNIYKLNLKNQDRKFITSLINRFFSSGRCDIRTCFEKKKAWNGLLHHIHYKATTPEAQSFVDAMRGRENNSVFSDFERAMTDKNIKEAVDALKSGKGSAAVLRNMNYILSRCKAVEDMEYVVNCIDTRNVIVLIQLLMEYADYSKKNAARTFKFTKYNQLRVHKETPDEAKKRRSHITEGQAEMLAERIMKNLRAVLKNRLGKVYIDPDMKNYALPIQENTSQGGYGVLTRGSRIHIGEAKKLRAFTYWEKVNDIDLSVFGIDKNGECTEFSWRTMAGRQSDAITYSGDETSGFNGGSEYFDIDTEKFRKEYPDMRYLVFCDNVYSRVHFNKCLCKAGYMVRDTEDSGAVYEPKTVKSAFIIDSDSVFAYLFGVDLGTNDFIWLNMARDSSANVAGTTDMSFITDYFNVTDVINVASFFEMMATEVVDDMSEADVIVTDKNLEGAEKLSDAEIIRDYDFEKLIALMNK
ncbi:MAG TPA: hypothetical protein DEO83_08640 [Lachnospiraceae bacterium]|nr:hypothetical protein [Lachnospiraceae bacterium]